MAKTPARARKLASLRALLKQLDHAVEAVVVNAAAPRSRALGEAVASLVAVSHAIEKATSGLR